MMLDNTHLVEDNGSEASSHSEVQPVRPEPPLALRQSANYIRSEETEHQNVTLRC